MHISFVGNNRTCYGHPRGVIDKVYWGQSNKPQLMHIVHLLPRAYLKLSCLSLDILLPLIKQTFVQPAAGSNINLIAAICEWRKIIKTNLVDSLHTRQRDRHGATGELCLSIVGLCQDDTQIF